MIGVLICVRDRPTELSLLLQSLRTQTYKDFRIYIVDDCSGTPLATYHFLNCVMNKLNEEGNFVTLARNDFNYGVSKSRQRAVDIALSDGYCDLLMRVDDDVILEADYIEKLMKVINQGYDLATGVTPFIGQAQFKRESKFIRPVGNRVILNDKGEFLFNGDDFGMLYNDEAIIPIHHFRSCALYKASIHEKVSYESRLSKHGFREEQLLSFKMILAGYKMAVNTAAIAWHLLTPSGGERFADSNELVKINEQVLHEYTRDLYLQHGDFIGEYNKRLGISSAYTPEDLIKQTNCIVR